MSSSLPSSTLFSLTLFLFLFLIFFSSLVFGSRDPVRNPTLEVRHRVHLHLGTRVVLDVALLVTWPPPLKGTLLLTPLPLPAVNSLARLSPLSSLPLTFINIVYVAVVWPALLKSFAICVAFAFHGLILQLPFLHKPASCLRPPSRSLSYPKPSPGISFSLLLAFSMRGPLLRVVLSARSSIY